MKRKHAFIFRLISLGTLVAIALSMVSCGLAEGVGNMIDSSQSESSLVTEYTFKDFDSHEVRGGYYSGVASPSIDVNLSDPFDLKALARKGYVCDITVSYDCLVNGDHLNIACAFSGPVNKKSDYEYLPSNSTKWLEFSAYNIPADSIANNPTLNIKWSCEGITWLDGINECEVSGIRVEVRFVKD